MSFLAQYYMKPDEEYRSYLRTLDRYRDVFVYVPLTIFTIFALAGAYSLDVLINDGKMEVFPFILKFVVFITLLVHFGNVITGNIKNDYRIKTWKRLARYYKSIGIPESQIQSDTTRVIKEFGVDGIHAWLNEKEFV